MYQITQVYQYVSRYGSSIIRLAVQLIRIELDTKILLHKNS